MERGGPKLYLLIPTGADPVFPNLRLAAGSQASQGRVEIFYASQWWGICPDLWHLADAQVICHQLGYTKATSISTGVDPQHTRGYLLSKVNCSGSEIRLSECNRVYGVHSCVVDQYAEAQCKRDSLEVRLNGGRHYAAGRVEIKYDNEWRGMCADFFDNSTAMIICRQLGYDPNLIADAVQTFANYTVPKKEAKIEFLPFQATCRPSATQLVQCTREYGLEECPSGEYATLTCAGGGVNALHKLGVVLGVVTIALIIVHLMAYLKYKYDQKQEEKALKGATAYTAGTQEDTDGARETENTDEGNTPVDTQGETQGDTKDSTQSTIEMNSVSGAVPV